MAVNQSFIFCNIELSIYITKEVVMKLVLAEKPSVAKTIASFLGAKTRSDGYFQGITILLHMR